MDPRSCFLEMKDVRKPFLTGLWVSAALFLLYIPWLVISDSFPPNVVSPTDLTVGNEEVREEERKRITNYFDRMGAEHASRVENLGVGRSDAFETGSVYQGKEMVERWQRLAKLQAPYRDEHIGMLRGRADEQSEDDHDQSLTHEQIDYIEQEGLWVQ